MAKVVDIPIDLLLGAFLQEGFNRQGHLFGWKLHHLLKLPFQKTLVHFGDISPLHHLHTHLERG
ncbi:MAG TPA: hypothetical protein PLB68_10275, partial [Candidatus Aminicenantes bacterium]|nr:hypothetical protein [Candidatus Aminicenantes bacterium]